MLANPYQKYQQNQIDTASPGKLLIMLYDGALKFTQAAREGVTEKDFEKANNNIIKVQNIISELMTSLDMEKGDVATNLYSLYDYMNNRLIEANIQKDEKVLTEVEGLLKDLKNTWQEAILKG